MAERSCPHRAKLSTLSHRPSSPENPVIVIRVDDYQKRCHHTIRFWQNGRYTNMIRPATATAAHRCHQSFVPPDIFPELLEAFLKMEQDALWAPTREPSATAAFQASANRQIHIGNHLLPSDFDSAASPAIALIIAQIIQICDNGTVGYSVIHD